MLLVDHVPLRLARVWLHREKVEHEAAAQFHRLGGEMRAAGLPRRIIDLADAAAADEAEHAILCRRVVDHLAPGLAPLVPDPVGPLGPVGLSAGRRALYASVALACVTETFSTALLLEMQRLATDPLVGATVHRILRDEINHSRLGWGHLAWAVEREDVSWLALFLVGMVHALIRSDLPPASYDDETAPADQPGEGQGVLSAARIRDVATRAFEDVIAPGLARYGIVARSGA